MAVALDATSTAAINDTTGGISSHSGTLNITIGASANLLTVWMMWPLSATSVAAHWDSAGANQLMTQIGSANNAGALITVQLWRVVNPTTGSGKTINVTWTGAADEFVVFGQSWTGVDTTTPTSGLQTGTGNNLAAAGSTTLTSISSAVGNAVIGAFVNDFVWKTAPTTNQTDVLLVNGSLMGAVGGRANGAASVSIQAVNGATIDNWAAVGCNLNASAGGGAVTNILMPQGLM